VLRNGRVDASSSSISTEAPAFLKAPLFAPDTMSVHVYIAREGFKENPIPLEDWLTAARQNEELVVEEAKNQLHPSYIVSLKRNKRARFVRTPYGLIDAQDPCLEQVRTMFQLANLLGAGVYSDQLERYQSADDWDEKTRESRQDLALRQTAYRLKRRMIIFYVIVLLIACALIGYLIKI
jgi:hypothetical protein